MLALPALLTQICGATRALFTSVVAEEEIAHP